MKIKTKNLKNSSMNLIVPVDGLITIDANGVAEVSAKCAVVLVTSTNDWDYLKKSKEEDATDSKNESSATKTENAELSEREELQEKLKSMKLEDMKEMAKEVGLPEEEWEKLNSKKLMSAYLIKKYDEVSAAD